jgi:hypothetical protein
VVVQDLVDLQAVAEVQVHQEQLVMMDLIQEDGTMQEQVLTLIPEQAGFLVIMPLLVVLLN